MKQNQKRYCKSCDKSVYLCETVEELTHHSVKGRCVAFNPKLVANRGYGEYVVKIPVIDLSGSGESIWLSHFKRKAESLSSVYVTEPSWKLKSDAMKLYQHSQGTQYEFYFTQFAQDEKLEFSKPFVVIVCPASDQSALEIAEKIRTQYFCVFLITHNPNTLEAKQLGMYHLEIDCSSSKLATEAFKQIASAYHQAFYVEEMGFALFD